MKNFFKYVLLFFIGGVTYYGLECMFKSSHSSHWSMFVLAGIVFIISGLINEIYPWEMPLVYQCSIAGLFIATPLEYIFGLVFNANYTIWDYRNSIGTLHFLDDQVNIFFILLWILLCGICIVLDDFIRWKFFKEDKPHYKVF